MGTRNKIIRIVFPFLLWIVRLLVGFSDKKWMSWDGILTTCGVIYFAALEFFGIHSWYAIIISLKLWEVIIGEQAIQIVILK
jgi:hypothetical protein